VRQSPHYVSLSTWRSPTVALLVRQGGRPGGELTLMSLPVPVSRWGHAASSLALCTPENPHVRAHSAAPVAPAPEPAWASPQAQTVQEAPVRRSSEWVALKVHMQCSQNALQRGHLRFRPCPATPQTFACAPALAACSRVLALWLAS
jgi:hypothetical protein